MRKENILFIPNHCYHIYNRAVGNEKFFIEEKNYDFFIRKMQLYILPISDIFCYNLLPNHFHLFLRIKPEEVIEAYLKERKQKDPEGFKKPSGSVAGFKKHSESVELPAFISEQFGNWCNSYTKSFNKVYNRKGKLFMDNLNRKEITDSNYYSRIVQYVHQNAVRHKLVKHISEWRHSSYHLYLHNDKNSFLKTDELLEWFGGKENFVKAHNIMTDYFEEY